MLRASIAAMTEDYNTSDEILLSEKKRLEDLNADDDLIGKISIVYVQTLISRERYADALTYLSDISSVKFTPAGVSSIYYLRALQEASEGGKTSTILDKVASGYLVEVAAELDECTDAEYSAASGTQTLLFIAQILEQRQCHRACADVLQILLRCGSDDLDSTQRINVTAFLVTALSYENPEEAERYASSLPQFDGGEFDALELESADIPRLMKKQSGAQSENETTAGDSRALAEEARRKKKTLARRAARKTAYLKKLEEEGKYDPARPVKPDAERWIPMKQRSYNKRGRKNRGKFVGGQGSGDGAQKDMLKLDAMARSQAEKPANTGTVISSNSGGGNKKKKGKKKK